MSNTGLLNRESASFRDNKKNLRITAFLLFLFPFSLLFAQLPRDASGWTQFKPSADSRILYVANNGNDSTGQIYSTSTIRDPFNPGNVNAYSTFAAASLQTRPGYPDWILFLRGDTFSANISLRSGRNAAEPALVAAYGQTGSMPVIHPLNSAASAVVIPRRTEHSAISGLDFYAIKRNPEIQGYTTAGETGFSGVTGQIIQNILIEGCRFRFFSGNRLQATDNGRLENITIRRTVISDNYSTGEGHSQGLYMAFARGVVIEESIFDHNGWYSKSPRSPGTATMFNHNTYFEDCHAVIFRGNVFSRGSSMGNKFTANSGVGSSSDITLQKNIYIDGEIGIGIGGNKVGQYRFKNVTVEGNLFTEIGRSQPTGRTLGWALDAVGWDGGSISGNYFLNFSNPAVTNIYAIRLEGGSRNVRIAQNVIYRLNPHGNSNMAQAMVIAATKTAASQGILITRNTFYEPNKQFRLLQVDGPNELVGIAFRDNNYFSINTSTAVRVGNANRALPAWAEQTGDTAGRAAPTFPDPTRSIESYMKSIQRRPAIDDFITACRNQTRYAWDDKVEAEKVIDWIKAGFELP